jgi:signal recognition particle subunit SRP54
VAAGAGVDVAEINRLLKQHRQMADMFKSMSKGGGRQMQAMAAALGMGGGGAPGGLPPGMGGGPDLARLKALGGGKLPNPSLGADPAAGAPDLSKLGQLGAGLDLSKLGGLGLPGLPGSKKKP